MRASSVAARRAGPSCRCASTIGNRSCSWCGAPARRGSFGANSAQTRIRSAC